MSTSALMHWEHAHFGRTGFDDTRLPARRGERVELKQTPYNKEHDWRDWAPASRGLVTKADGRIELMPVNSRLSKKEMDSPPKDVWAELPEERYAQPSNEYSPAPTRWVSLHPTLEPQH